MSYTENITVSPVSTAHICNTALAFSSKISYTQQQQYVSPSYHRRQLRLCSPGIKHAAQHQYATDCLSIQSSKKQNSPICVRRTEGSCSGNKIKTMSFTASMLHESNGILSPYNEQTGAQHLVPVEHRSSLCYMTCS